MPSTLGSEQRERGDFQSELLRDRYGYRVTTLLNATRAEILQALAHYRRILGVSDNLMIYYAGHGWLDEEEDRGYWLPVDATQDDDVYWDRQSGHYVEDARHQRQARHDHRG